MLHAMPPPPAPLGQPRSYGPCPHAPIARVLGCAVCPRGRPSAPNPTPNPPTAHIRPPPIRALRKSQCGVAHR